MTSVGMATGFIGQAKERIPSPRLLLGDREFMHELYLRCGFLFPTILVVR